MAGFGLIAIALILLVALAVAIMYFLNLQDTLKEVSMENREVPAVNAWLLLIPLFSIVYAFIFYPKICNSIKKEYEKRGWASSGDFGKNLGLAMAILGVTVLLPIQAVKSVASIASLVVLIIFWVKMYNYKIALRNSNGESTDLLDN